MLRSPRHTRPPEMTGVARGLSPDTCSHDKRRALYLKWRRPNLVGLLLNHPSPPNALHTVANSAGLVLPALEAHTSSTGGAPVLVHGSLCRYMAFHVVPAEVSKKKEVPDFAPEVPGFGQVKVSGFALQVPGFVHL